MAIKGLTLNWEKDPKAFFDAMKQSKQNVMMRRALRKAGSVFSKDVKRVAPKHYGALRVAIGFKVSTGERSKKVSAVIGAKSEYKRFVKKRGVMKRRQSGARKGEAYQQWPAKYYHLVQSGHRKRATKKSRIGRMTVKLRRFFTGSGYVKGIPFAVRQLRAGWPTYSRIIMGSLSDDITKAMNVP